MEVHHHPKVEKKNFKEYFLEFLMIFLAVTLGFFADNIREGFSNREKEKDYMVGFIEDLKADTALLRATVERNTEITSDDSNFLTILRSNKLREVSDSAITGFENTSRYFFTDLIETKTFEELKSTGDIRVVRNQKVKDALFKYYGGVESSKLLRDEIQRNVEFCYHNLDDIMDTYAAENHIGRNNYFTADKNEIKKYSNNLYNLISQFKVWNIYVLPVYQTRAAKLIQLIQKEYNLKNE